MDLISVIIPVYNVEKYIRECLDSIINQTYKKMEIILVDDGSSDNSGEICDEYKIKDNRIKVIHKTNGGLSDARNAGMKIATGKYIQFIDSDDFIDKDMIETLYNLITEDNADISMCSNYILKGEEQTSDYSGKKYIYNRIDALKEILLDEKIRSYAWNKLMKRELFTEIEFPNGKVFEDILTIPKIFEKSSKIVFLDVPKYYYRQREGSILNNQTNELRLSYINAAKEINKFIEEKEPSLKDYCAYNIAHITIKTYNDIGFFNMYDLLNEEIVNDLYEQTKKIFEQQQYEELIIKNSTDIKKLHFYYLLSDKEGYIKNNKILPVIYPEYKKLKKDEVKKGGKDVRKIILFDGPAYGNIGDLAIAISEKRFIKENLPQFEFMEILAEQIDNEVKVMRDKITRDDVILLTGGGNLGDEYIWFEQKRRMIIETFPNNKIIIMPQTIHFSDTECGKKELENTRKIYNNHKYLTVVAREKASFDIMKKVFSNINVILTPDIVMYLNEKSTEERNGVVMAMRNDLEKILTAEDMEKIKLKVSKEYDNIITTDTHLGKIRVPENEREKVFYEKLEEFSKAQLVITDRLHGMIFAAVTSTPCIALGNYNHKIESSFEWLKTQNYIKFLNNLDELDVAIDELASKDGYNYNNEFALKEYGQILDIINS